MKVDSAMIMAAGLGTRMRPLTENKPKPLVEVAGKTLLDHVLDKARDAGISNVVVNVHYLPEQVEAHLSMHAADLNFTISDERDLLMETGGGLVKAESLIAAEPFYCLNSDAIWTEAAEQDSLKCLAQTWDGDRMDGLLLIVPRERAFQHPGKGDFSRCRQQTGSARPARQRTLCLYRQPVDQPSSLAGRSIRAVFNQYFVGSGDSRRTAVRAGA